MGQRRAGAGQQPLALGPVQLGLPDGRLVVRSTPAGASVTVGGAYRGRTPLEIEVRPGIAQVVSVLRDGYEPARREVSCRSRRTRASPSSRSSRSSAK